jgi:hypothetical protein
MLEPWFKKPTTESGFLLGVSTLVMTSTSATSRLFKPILKRQQKRMTKGFDEKVKKLKALEDKIATLNETKEKLRGEIFSFFEKESLDQYKVDGVATISRVVRRVVKLTQKPEEIIARLKQQQLVKYYATIPQQIIPEQTVFSKQFDSDIKEGKFTIEGVELQETASIMTRFDK